MRSVRVIIPYFGSWPEWFPLFLRTCAANPSFDWLFFSDCTPPAAPPANVQFRPCSLAAYAAHVSSRLGIRFQPESAYKICDMRPTIGCVHAEELEGYDNFAFGDIDLFYGDLRRHYPDALLERLLVSTHARYVSGHFCVLRNDPLGRNLFRLVPFWRALLENPAYVAFEDGAFTRLFLGVQPHQGKVAKAYRALNPLLHLSSFEERFTTPLTWFAWTDGSHRHPSRWFWRDGTITNDIDGERTFPYLHIANYKNNRYLARIHGSTAAWSALPQVVQLPIERAVREGWTVSARGISPLEPECTRAGAPVEHAQQLRR